MAYMCGLAYIQYTHSYYIENQNKYLSDAAITSEHGPKQTLKYYNRKNIAIIIM